MQKIIVSAALTVALALPLMAQAADDMNSTTVASSSDVTKGYLKNEVVGLKPEVGTILYQDPTTGVINARGAVGLDASWNVAGLFFQDTNRQLFIGPNTGVLYSHIGSGDSNFFGSNSTSLQSNQGSNLLLIPADLKIGYAVADNIRVSAHGGGNVIYRTVASAVNLGESSGSTDSAWKIFPNAGLDFEFGFGSNIAVLIRPDVTFTPGNDLFAGTVGLGIALG